MANTGHMDDDHSNDRPGADVFGTAGNTLRLREGDDAPQSHEADETSDAEARMRQALGLFGTRPGGGGGGEHGRHHEQHSGGDRRPAGGGPGARRHRFVQDGEVPVSVVRGRTGQRPQAVEGERHADEIAHERQLRAEAERKLGEREVQLRSLQTRIGHAELERDNALTDAREWREKAEAALAAAAPVAVQSTPAAPEVEREIEAEPRNGDDTDMESQGTSGPRGARRGPRRRVDEPQLDLIDPEPVKWWL